jgi:parvulin-like peptidyl-prolyl isomerase
MNKRIVLLISAIAGIFVLSQSVSAADAPPPTAPESLYATVNGKAITQKDFRDAYSNYLRQKFYHGQVPEDQLEPARKEVSNRLIERILLLDDATRRGLAADEKKIGMTIAEYDARYAASPMWQKNRESMLPGLKLQLAEQDLLRQMEVIGHTVAEPTEEAVQEFHKKRIELFTEPEKMRLHTILLKVDPSAPKSLWDAAREEASRIVARLRSGAGNFEELAGLHSHDRSADKGGDMGYVHLGMIPAQVQTQLEALPPGTVGNPIDVLEGVAIFRLDGRIPPKVMAYQDVAVRARELLKREQRDQAWDSFIAGLRKTAAIKMVEVAPPPANK